MKLIKKTLIALTLVVVLVGSTSAAWSSAEYIQKNNVIGIRDFKYYIYHDDSEVQHYMTKNLTGWMAKDPYNTVTLTYQSSVSGTSYSETTVSGGVEAELIKDALKVSGTVSHTKGFSYTATEMKGFSWPISPSTPGDYHAIAINTYAIKTKVKVYEQEWHIFGQGDWFYVGTAYAYTPDFTYKSRNYRNEGSSNIYRAN